MSNYTPSSSSSLRYRSGSVERSRVSSSRDPAPYRTSYGSGTERGRPRDLPSSGASTRMSRATSYDPFASSARSNSVIRSTGVSITGYSGQSGASNSDYTSRNTTGSSYTSRYGSTEQLSSYRPSYRSGSTSSGSTSTTTSSYTPRNVRAGSVSIGAYDPPSSRVDLASSSLSRYRPASSATETSSYTPSISRYRSTDLSSTSDYSTSKYRSPDNSYSSRCSSLSSTVSNRYSSKPYSSRTSTSSSYRSDRDYRSMSRTTDNEEEDEVENTFRKLYRKYVTDSEPDLSKNEKIEESLAEKISRRFESKSEAEDSENSISEEDEDEILSKYQSKGLRRASSASSITPRASVCNSPSKDVTPKCSPLPSRKKVVEVVEKSVSRSASPEAPQKSIDFKPLTRSFQMEATFGVLAVSAISAIPVQEENLEKVSEPLPTSKDPQKPSEMKKIATSIKINGIPMKNEETSKTDEKQEKPFGLEEKIPVRIRIRSDKSPGRSFEAPSPEQKSIGNLISSAANVVLHQENQENEKSIEKDPEFSKEKSSESDTTTSSRASTLRKRRDPNRTLENLQSILKAEKMKDSNSQESSENSENSEGSSEKSELSESHESPEAQPEKPSENDEKPENPEENPEKKMRRIPIPLVLITEPSNPSTPLATTPVTTAASICLWNKRSSSSTEGDEEYEDEDEYSSGDWTEGEDDEEYITDEEEEFSVSQTFSLKDHMNLQDLYPLATSASNTSALVSEFSDGDTFLTNERKEESRGRVDSLFAVPAPIFTSSVTYDGMIPEEEDEEEWSDEVHSCEEGDDEDFRVLPIVRPGSSSLGAYMSPGSMTSEEDYDGRTVGCTLKLVDRAARKDSESDGSEYYDDEEEIEDEEYEDEEYWDEEIEYEDEEEYEYEDEEELEEYVDEEEEEEDATMKSVESSVHSEDVEIEEELEEEAEELFVTPMKLMTESLVEEMIEEACYGELPEEELFALDGIEVEDYTGTKDVQMIPTFVRQMTENVKEESTSRFSDRKPSTDFARKAVIQPTKLEKVQVGSKIDTKLAPSEEEKRKKKEEEERKKKEVEEEKRRKEAADAAKKEDKSALRKSALNMKDEDAKKKVATDEKNAAQKARRFGTVSAMAGKFDEKDEKPEVVKKKEGVLYKKSSRLESKDAEKPKRTYEVIKPVINDDFDKQMEEIRQQMKSGSSELQNKMKMLSKGILTATEEAKSKEMEEKRRMTAEKATGAFGKAEEEKARWKASRDAEAAREYAKIEAEKHLKKKRILIDKPSGETVLNQEKAEPKRTVRRWKPPPPDPNAVIPSFSCGPKEPVKPKIPVVSDASKPSSKPTTPTARRKVVSPAVVTPTPMTTVIPSATVNIPKSEGAAATRIRNNANASPVTVAPGIGAVSPATVTQDSKEPRGAAKRYSSRRKTQEIVNESAVKPKSKRRKTNPRKKRFVREDRDVDLMLGLQKGSTFEQLERLFDQSSRNRRPVSVSKFEKIRRMAPSKIFISDLTDIDKIYKSSEIRDIIASVNLIY